MSEPKWKKVFRIRHNNIFLRTLIYFSSWIILPIAIIISLISFTSSALSTDSIFQPAIAQSSIIQLKADAAAQQPPSVQSLTAKAVSQINTNSNTNTTTNITTADTTSSTINNNSSFLTYDNPTAGLRIRYPSNWSVMENVYNSTTNNTVARFLSTAKTGSELGNLSGVSGNFIPYLDIFVFDSKNMSLDQIVKGRIDYFSNKSNFVIHETKPFTIDNNNKRQPGYMLDYSVTVGGDELFRKRQAWTISSGNVYVITFTAQQALFSNYMPTVAKMINSFEIQTKTK